MVHCIDKDLFLTFRIYRSFILIDLQQGMTYSLIRKISDLKKNPQKLGWQTYFQFQFLFTQDQFTGT